MTNLPDPSGTRVWDLPESEALEEITERLTRVGRRTIERILYRATYLRHLDVPEGSPVEPLYYLGSLAGARYTPRKGPAGLYLAYDPATPAAELRAVVFAGGRVVRTEEHDPIVTVAVRATLHHVLDLTDDDTCRTLDLTDLELRADWEQGQDGYLRDLGPMPATQLLALAAHTSGLVTAIKYKSARTDFGTNLVVFPDRLSADAGDLLEVIDSKGRLVQRLPSPVGDSDMTTT